MPLVSSQATLHFISSCLEPQGQTEVRLKALNMHIVSGQAPDLLDSQECVTYVSFS